MNDEDLKAAILTQNWDGQWEPKRLRLTNGETHQIPHPGAVAIGRRVCSIVVYGRLLQVANLHIAEVEPLEAAVG